jgi:fluoride ion exporter CrcB/FEX
MTSVPRRIAAETLFANLIALFLLAIAATGCGMEQSQSERPDWSLNGPDRPAQ